MGTHIITDEEEREIMDDFLEEQDTEPLLLMTVQDQLNSATSVIAFIATARTVQPREEMHWTDRLELELDDVDLTEVTGIDLR